MAAVATFLAGCGLACGVLALATWGDGDPAPWIWISLACSPLAAAVGGIAWLAGRAPGTLARTATAVSALVTLFWVVVFALLVTGER
jgi:hypothetical protein